jgi:hypothetical protein
VLVFALAIDVSSSDVCEKEKQERLDMQKRLGFRGAFCVKDMCGSLTFILLNKLKYYFGPLTIITNKER